MTTLTEESKGNFWAPQGQLARTLSKRQQVGNPLFHSFPSHLPAAHPSFYGWRQHVTGSTTSAQPINPPGLTRYPSMGENWALKLSTPDKPIGEIPANQQQFAVYKNMSRHFTVAEAKLISFSGYFASMPAREAPGANWALGMDCQTWGNTKRSFFKTECRYPSGTGAAQWYLVNNAGSAVVIEPTNVTKRHTAGINQNKANLNYVELTVKLEANEEAGAYYSLQVNDLYFDLFNETTHWPESTQRGAQTPQGSEADPTTSAAHLLNYDGGTNFGIFGSAPSVEGSHPYRLICTDLMATVYDV